MKAPEYLPLILEPHSRLYTDPLIVLDFQSLYPSMIIAYNYCFSTCLGRVELLGKYVDCGLHIIYKEYPLQISLKLGHIHLNLVLLNYAYRPICLES